jgi:ATP-dependent DNA helicase RecG
MKFPELESTTVEWKQELPKHDQIVRTLVGFCNRSGGKLIIGVANNGTIVGVDENRVQHWMEYLDKLIYESSSPPILPLIYSQRIGEKTVLILEVSSGMNKPYYVKKEGLEKGTYVRLGRSTLHADADMIEELKWASHGRSFDTMPVYHAKESDLDFERIRQFLKDKTALTQPVTKEILLSYHLITEEHTKKYPTVAGLLLFGFNPQAYLSESFIICSHFAGISGREAIATVDCTGTLFDQLTAVEQFLFARLSRSFSIEDLKRKEELEIPPIAFREILLNAIVHRNYHIKAPIKIALYDNRIEVFSPGDFPGPLTTENLLRGLTYIRNGAICKVFREAGYIEKLGSGFTTVFNAYAERGLKTPQIIEGENYVKCILPRELGDLPKMTEKEQAKAKILSMLAVSPQITMSDIMTHLGLPRSTVGRRLAEMTQEGSLQKIGQGKNSYYVNPKL